MSQITDFCIEECKRQNDLTFEAVAGMVEAYLFALEYFTYQESEFSLVTLCEMATMVKPQNSIGFRKTPVVFANGTEGLNYSLIERAMKNLFDNMYGLSPEKFYIEFEKIYPFEDGNERLGAIMYNMLKGRHAFPIPAPDVF